MKTTITELHRRPCGRCGGRGHLPQFQHLKAGECFRCGGTGADPVLHAVERPMTNQEVLDALALAGFPVVWPEHPETGDYLADLFLSDEEAAQQAAAMEGARQFLAAL